MKAENSVFELENSAYFYILFSAVQSDIFLLWQIGENYLSPKKYFGQW